MKASAESTGVEVYRGRVALSKRDLVTVQLEASRGAAIGRGGDSPLASERVARVIELAEKTARLVGTQGTDELAVMDYSQVFGTAELVAEGPVREKAPSGSSLPAKPQKVQEQGPADLLGLAREAKKQRDWAKAASIYGRLVGEYPASSAANVALISLGELELKRMGRPKAALGRFNSYLSKSSGGNLAMEALWGRARALKTLGQTGAEKVALERFIKLYPGAFQTDEARHRISELE